MTNEQSIMEHIYELEQELALAKSTIKVSDYNFNVERTLRACQGIIRNFNNEHYYPYLISSFKICGIDTETEDFNTSIIWTTMQWIAKERNNEYLPEYFIEKIIEGLRNVKFDDQRPLIIKVTKLYLRELKDDRCGVRGE
jgi:hypothetical protein